MWTLGMQILQIFRLGLRLLPAKYSDCPHAHRLAARDLPCLDLLRNSVAVDSAARLL